MELDFDCGLHETTLPRPVSRSLGLGAFSSSESEVRPPLTSESEVAAPLTARSVIRSQRLVDL